MHSSQCTKHNTRFKIGISACGTTGQRDSGTESSRFTVLRFKVGKPGTPNPELRTPNPEPVTRYDIFESNSSRFAQNAMFAPPARHPVHRARWRKNRGSEFKVQSSRFKVQGSIPYHLSLITSIASAVGAAIVLGGECLGLACESDAAECDGRQDNCTDNDDLYVHQVSRYPAPSRPGRSGTPRNMRGRSCIRP